MFEKLYVAHVHNLKDRNNTALKYDLIDGIYQSRNFGRAYRAHDAMAHILGKSNHGSVENLKNGQSRLLVRESHLINRKVGNYSKKSLVVFRSIKERLNTRALSVSRKIEAGSPMLGGHSYSILGGKRRC